MVSDELKKRERGLLEKVRMFLSSVRKRIVRWR